MHTAAACKPALLTVALGCATGSLASHGVDYTPAFDAPHPNIKRFPGGASNDMIPNLQNPENPLPYDPIKLPNTVHIGD